MQDWWQDTFPKSRQSITITDANGYPVSIAYGEKGTGKPLILVHGIGSWSYGWRYNIEPLSQHFKVIAFDAKGNGFSDKPAYPDQPGHQAIELARIIQSLCDEPALVVAESLGALTALACVESHPELFEKLVLINVPIFPQGIPNRGMQVLSSIPLDLIKIVDQLRLASFFSPLVRYIFAIERQDVVVDATAITEEDVYWITYPYIEFPNTITKYTEDLQHAAIEIQRLQQKLPSLIGDIQENLGKITCPTLILWADKDNWFPVKDGEKLQRFIPNSRLEILNNCGHDAAATCPDQVNQRIIEFLCDR
ncbi:alpha/beta hydrolase fold protein [Crinalium epipsammum PCC 9333]|uniref:Alpha/beta hydrolase fold protein n=1 Tax=Crinalium epipsammum PCC 9333 TaxID=1173022 RepID=K9W6R1_9CYAN|nr:alpha/beta hydrolase [Crinalium epipsammum]AFZ15140.1 alpha/beta hydrolase fold protein [Crinalium epipsammum PCC 9333]